MPAEPIAESTSWRWRMLALGLVLLLGLGAYGVLQSPLFRLEKIAVKGIQRLSEDRVVEAVGLAPGAISWGNPAELARQRVLRLSWVKEARVTWQVPGELRVEVVEREPLAVLPYYNQHLLLDETGRVLALTPNIVGLRLPVITGISVLRAGLGDTPDAAGLQVALETLRFLDPIWRADLSEVNADKQKGITLYTHEGIQVLVGPPTQLDFKMGALVSLWQEARQQQAKLKYIDLRNPNQPSVMPRSDRP